MYVFVYRVEFICQAIYKLNELYTGVFGNFRLVGDDGDLSAVVSTSVMMCKWRRGVEHLVMRAYT